MVGLHAVPTLSEYKSECKASSKGAEPATLTAPAAPVPDLASGEDEVLDAEVTEGAKAWRVNHSSVHGKEQEPWALVLSPC